MTPKLCPPILFFCILLTVVFIPPVTAQQPAMQPFAEPNHRLAFDYPDEWFTLLYSPETVYLSNMEQGFYVPAVQTYSDLQEGQIALHLELRPKAIFPWLADAGYDPRQLLIVFTSAAADTSDQVYEVSVNGKPGARFDEGNSTQIIFALDEANFIFATLYTQPENLSSITPTLDEILASIRLIPEQGHNIPLEPLTAFNADEIALLATIYTDYAAYDVDFSADGKHMLSVGDSGLILWDVATLQPLTTFGNPGYRAAYTLDGDAIATITYDDDLFLWNTTDLTHSTRIGQAGEVSAAPGLAFSLDGRLLAFATNDNNIHLWDMDAGTETVVMNGHSDSVFGLAFSADGRFLASSAFREAYITVWDVGTGRRVRTMPTGEVTDMAFSPTSTLIALNTQSSNGQTPQLWDIESGQVVAKTNAFASYAHSLQFNADGTLLMELDSNSSQLSVRSVFTGKQLFQVQAQAGYPYTSPAFALRRDERMIATGGIDHIIHLWGVPAA